MNERIAELRQALGLSMGAFADRLGVVRSTISRMESGVNKITESTIITICRVFNVRREWLETGEGEMFEPELEDLIDRIVRERNFSPISAQFIKAVVSMDDKQLAAVYQFVQAVAQADKPDTRPAQLTEEDYAAADAVAEQARSEYLRQKEAEVKSRASPSTA